MTKPKVVIKSEHLEKIIDAIKKTTDKLREEKLEVINKNSLNLPPPVRPE
jgi:hypothetical protein